MAQLGADVEQLDSLARRMQEASSQIEQLATQLSSQVSGAWWQGDDANRFRADWDGTYRAQLRNVADRLQQTGTLVTQQANAQRQASSA